MPELVGTVNPRALEAHALARLMAAFADVENVWCDIFTIDDETHLGYFVGEDELTRPIADVTP